MRGSRARTAPAIALQRRGRRDYSPSRQAYAFIAVSGKAQVQRAKIVRALTQQPGMTRNEISAATGLPINHVCGRVDEMLSEGILRRGAQRPSRITGVMNETLHAMMVRFDTRALARREKEIRQVTMEAWSS